MSDYALGDIADIRQGRYLAKDEMSEHRTASSPIPVHGANGIIGWTARSMYDDGVALVTCRGSNSGMVLWADGPLWVSNNAMAVLPHDGRAELAYYALKNSPPYDVVSGSAQPQITRAALAPRRYLWPDADQQEGIAALLSALDEKIALIRRMNETLDAAAWALFRDWFVDFGPTRAKVQGAPAWLAPDIWSLFPDRLGDDDVPEGWCETPLDEVADFLNGLASQKYPAEPGAPSLPVIKIAELRSGVSDSSNRASFDVPAKYVVSDGDFLFSWSGSLLAKFWTEGAGALNQHLFKVTSDRYPAWFFSQWVWHHLAEFQVIAASKATTMGHIQRGHLRSAMTITPPLDTLAAMGSVMQPLLDRVIGNLIESRSLAVTRDALLPKLMSGEVRVRDAEALVAA